MEIDPTNKAMINNFNILSEGYRKSYHCDKNNNGKRAKQYERNNNKESPASDQRSDVAKTSKYCISSSNSKESFSFKESVQHSPTVESSLNESSTNKKDQIKAEQKVQQAVLRSEQADRNKHRDFERSRLLYSEVIDLYSEAIKLDPAKASYYNKRAECYIKLKNHNEAVFDFLKVLELNPLDKTAYPKAAESLMIVGNIAEAETVLIKFYNLAGQGALKVESAKSLKLKFLKASKSEIDKLYEQENFAGCLEVLNEVLEIAEVSEKFQNCKVECLLMLGRLDEAEKLVKKMLASSNLGYSALLEGIKIFRQGDFPKSIEKLEEFRGIITGLEYEAKLLKYVKLIWNSYQKGKKQTKLVKTVFLNYFCS